MARDQLKRLGIPAAAVALLFGMGRFAFPQASISSSLLAFQQDGTPVGTPSIVNCHTNLTCTLSAGVLTIVAAGSSGPTLNTPTAGGIAYGVNSSTYGTTGAGTAKQVVLSGGAGTPTFVSHPQTYWIPSATCNNATATLLWNGPTSGGMGNPTCVAVTGAFTAGAIAANTSNNGADTFTFELPGDWDTTQQPYIAIQYGSRTLTTGTVIWTISSACGGPGDGSGSEQPSYVAESSMGTQTMAAAQKMWRQSAQMVNVTSGNSCIPGGSVQFKVNLSGTAAGSVDLYGAIITIPRLLAVQGN